MEESSVSTRDRIAAIVKQGEACVAKRKYKEAIGRFKEVLQDEPEHAEAITNLALINARVGRWADAREHASHALKIDQRNHRAHFAMGCAFDAAKDFRSAIEAYKEAIMLDPDFEPAWYNLGNSLLEVVEVECIDAFKRATELRPSHDMAWKKLLHALTLWESKSAPILLKVHLDKVKNAPVRREVEHKRAYDLYNMDNQRRVGGPTGSHAAGGRPAGGIGLIIAGSIFMGPLSILSFSSASVSLTCFVLALWFLPFIIPGTAIIRGWEVSGVGKLVYSIIVVGIACMLLVTFIFMAISGINSMDAVLASSFFPIFGLGMLAGFVIVIIVRLASFLRIS
ncbi:MAG: tetratricopeptide repeat protein [Candidatus Lokiarchaeota archaeon]|nr:tetratricopeptide repeat protein [Candidatus Lokiarchaeota archaeon]